MPVRLCKWGNSTGLRLSAELMATAGLKQGDTVYVRLLDTGDIRIRPVGRKNSVEVVADDGSAQDSVSVPAQW